MSQITKVQISFIAIGQMKLLPEPQVKLPNPEFVQLRRGSFPAPTSEVPEEHKTCKFLQSRGVHIMGAVGGGCDMATGLPAQPLLCCVNLEEALPFLSLNFIIRKKIRGIAFTIPAALTTRLLREKLSGK